MAQGDAAAELPFPFPSTSAEPPTDSRGPGSQAIGDLLDSFRPYLLSIARRKLPADLCGKYDAADLGGTCKICDTRNAALVDSSARDRTDAPCAS
jgi:hypothetical protein